MANRNRLWMQILQPGKLGRLLLASLSVFSTLIGVFEFFRQNSSPVLVTYDTQFVVLPTGITPELRGGNGKIGKLSDFVAAASVLNPRTALTTIQLTNKKDEMVRDVHVRLRDVTRVLYVTGIDSERQVLSNVEVQFSSHTVDISGIPPLAPNSNLFLYVWGDHVNFGLSPVDVTSDHGNAAVTTLMRVRGMAKTFAYLMAWILTGYGIWVLWFAIDRFVIRRRWRLVA